MRGSVLCDHNPDRIFQPLSFDFVNFIIKSLLDLTARTRSKVTAININEQDLSMRPLWQTGSPINIKDVL